MKEKTPYDQLVEMSKTATLYGTISMLLDWDQETYMPTSAVELRSKQLELMSSLAHKERTSQKFGHALGSLIHLETGKILDSTLTPAKQAALREWRRDYMQQIRLPIEFVEEFARVTSESGHAWKEAKGKNQFKIFLPYLEKVVALCRQKADFLGYDEHPYDALLDQYEPGMKISVLKPLFERLKIPLIDLLKSIETKPLPNDSFLRKEYPHQKQLHFGKKILANMGFETNFCRLDESAHPMCMTLHPDDARLTTRVIPNQVMVNIFSCIHEGGHGLYHVNLPKEEFGTPLGEAASLGIDESQSRMWETITGRSYPFWQHYYPLLQKEFPEHLGEIPLDEFYKAVNIVKPTLIRTDSDEVTYNLHIMVRFELERGLLEGSIKPADIPEAWNEKMRIYLGIVPKADSEGCLQDIHWSLGGIGYFPTYTLGNLYAAQFFEKYTQENPNWETDFRNGQFAPLRNWLKTHIHKYGRMYLPEDLCKKVTGKPLSELPFLNYLQKKYSALYHL